MPVSIRFPQKTHFRLPYIVFTFFVLCFALYPLSPLLTGQLADPDDYMRLNQVLNWLQNPQGLLAGWYDTSVPRMAPGLHTIIHWSRLVDLPIALTMWPFTFFLNLHSAALVASFLVPLGLFALLLLLAPALTKNLTDEKQAQWSCALLLFAPALLFNFTPGRVDHHAYQILIAGFGLSCLPHILHETKGWRHALLAALAFASGLWIGTEALPWLGIFLFLLALMAAWNGGLALRNAAIFGIVLAALTALILFLALPQSEFSSRALSWFSAADVILAGLSAAILIIGWLLGGRSASRFARIALTVALGTFAILLFIRFVPESLNGPFANYAFFNANTALDNITEAQPLAHALNINLQMPATILHALLAFATKLFLPFLALGVCLIHLGQSRDRTQQIWLMHFVFLLTAILLTLFCQIRIAPFMQLFALAPLTWFLQRAWKSCDRPQPPVRYTAAITAFLVLGPLPVLLLPAIANSKTLFRDVLFFPAARMESSCNLKPTAEFLNQRYGDQNLVIMSGMNEGPELLFRSPLNVVGGNYNVAGNPDVLAFFNTRDDHTAQSLLHKWNATLVLTCRSTPPFFAGLDRPRMGTNAFLHTSTDGKLRLTSSLQNPALIEKLVNHKPPAWLKEIEIPGGGDYLLFEVRDRRSGFGGQGK